MPNFRTKTPMYERPDDISREDVHTSYESDNAGGKVEVSRYSDGTSTVHWGGPCGSSNYDEYGREC